jgi:hypothetical protein
MPEFLPPNAATDWSCVGLVCSDTCRKRCASISALPVIQARRFSRQWRVHRVVAVLNFNDGASIEVGAAIRPHRKVFDTDDLVGKLPRSLSRERSVEGRTLYGGRRQHFASNSRTRAPVETGAV